mmetsp:Transcript_17470/g.52768  ORF Transcript_17470/g.52768 Transcript_17470/m.52768 type:complete len:136 (+) Transcript_17470:202-609(+)
MYVTLMAVGDERAGWLTTVGSDALHEAASVGADAHALALTPTRDHHFIHAIASHEFDQRSVVDLVYAACDSAIAERSSPEEHVRPASRHLSKIYGRNQISLSQALNRCRRPPSQTSMHTGLRSRGCPNRCPKCCP